MGMGQINQSGGAGGAQQQSTLMNALLQQQLLTAIQQLNAQAQAQQQPRNGAVANGRRQPNQWFEEPQNGLGKVEVKRMEEESDEVVSAKYLRMAKDIKTDADKAQAGGDRPRAARLRAKVEQRLADIVEKFPGTPASKEAAKLLENLYR